jgi:peptide/nickel transport system substrate-binding protein
MFRAKNLWVAMLLVAGVIVSACASAATPTAAPSAAPTEAAAAPTTAAAQPTEAAMAATPAPKTADTFTLVTFGDPETLDPAVDYESAGVNVLGNIYEGLIGFDGADPAKFKPVLAEAIPDPVNTADGGVSYTWKIKDGVKFHNGDTLTTEDVAFSFWRSMLVGDPNAPSFLLNEAFFGVDDATELVNPDQSLVGNPDALKAASADKLAAACQQVKDAVTFDEASRTVTMKLVHPWGPFLNTLGGGNWAYVVDKQWVADQGDWNGDCATWQNFYGIPSESGIIRDKANGTGPYMLDHWTPQEEIVLTAFPGYRDGPAQIQRYLIKNVTEFGTRFAALQAGDADEITLGSKADETQMDTLVRETCTVDGQCQPVNADGILRSYKGLPTTNRTDVLFTFNIAEGSTYIGSGQLDGEGIPRDFFSDVHIRRAFNYCFDWDTYIKDVLLGDGVQSAALTLPGQLGYDGSPHYSYDLAKCEEEFKASTLQSADGQSLWDTGFYMQLAYNAGNTARQSIAEILAAGVAQVNPNFFIAPVSLPWPTFLRSQRAQVFPIVSVGWGEDLHDPHNWYVPYLIGTYAVRQVLPDDLKAKYADLINQGVLETDPAKRAATYSQLNQLVYEDAPQIILAVATGTHYEPLYLKGWLGSINQNPLPSSGYNNFYPYYLSK